MTLEDEVDNLIDKALSDGYTLEDIQVAFENAIAFWAEM